MNETNEVLILNNPYDIIQHINKRMAEDRFAHIEIRKPENKGVFDSLISKIRLWYDTNVCSCKKKGLNEQILINEYKNLKFMSDAEKHKAYKILGIVSELHHEGELVVKLS